MVLAGDSASHGVGVATIALGDPTTTIGDITTTTDLTGGTTTSMEDPSGADMAAT